jgi:hypothetical protein
VYVRLLNGSEVSSNLRDLAITPDGKDVVTACGAPYQHQVFSVTDFSPDGQYDSTNYPDAVALGADGTVFAGSDNYYDDSVFVFAPGNPTALASYSLGTYTDLAPAGLAVTPDDAVLFAVSADTYGDNPTLHIFRNPAQTTSSLAVSGPVSVHPNASITLTGSLSGPAPYTGGRTVRVSRTDSADPAGVTLPDVVTAADGSFTLSDTPQVRGAVTYHLSYAGDVHLTSSSATVTVLVGK